jgi:hypothetical protein
MNRVGIWSALTGVAIAVAFHATTAEAGFPANGARFISGEACQEVSSTFANCPMLSDGSGYWGGAVGDIYVDFNSNHGSGFAETILFACWMQYDASASGCNFATVKSNGSQDTHVTGFSSLSPTQYGTDTYYVQVESFEGDTINSVYGVTYAQ